MSTWQSTVSARIAAIRAHRGLSLSALAKRAEISKATLSGIEAGTGNPTLDTIESLAVALAIPVADLLAHDERSTTVSRAPRDGERLAVPPDIAQELMLRLPSVRSWEFWRLRMPAGSHFAGVHHVPGTAELILIVAGSMSAGPQDEAVELGPGDLVEFAGDCAHAYTAGPDGCHALVALGSQGDGGPAAEAPAGARSGAPRARGGVR